jgi:PQQ-dependent dehydrogenase (methanol/ethanol family)
VDDTVRHAGRWKTAGWFAAGAAGLVYLGAATTAQVSPAYSQSQSDAGKTLYDQQCASCHGSGLDNGEFAPALRGEDFLTRWSGKSVDELVNYVVDNMPPASPGSLGADGSLNVVTYLLDRNGLPPSPGNQSMTAELARQMLLPSWSSGTSVLAAGVDLPPNPHPTPNPLDAIRPVTDAMLQSPADGEWLSWRRTLDAQGFSPLAQITKDNVRQLRAAWAWTLPAGPNEATPLEHDGVLFVFGYRDVVQALNAVTGDLLWQYTRRLGDNVRPGVKKSMAIYGDRLFVPTSDAHIVALDVKTGDVVWDTALAERGYGITGGPIVARGNIIVGTRGPKPFIAALNATTGKEVWRFGTIAKPGEPGGDSWNGVPYEKRSGGTIWTPGSYDAAANLVFFGPAPTYDTGPLRDRIPGGNNDALYTNETLALNPETGQLVWHFAHLPNDQWDQDWAFERQILTLDEGGTPHRVVVTAGKEAIHDVMDAATGHYLFSIDAGIQNIVTAIDPKTGKKTIDPARIPGDGQKKFVCPDTSGGKNFTPSSYNPDTHMLYVPLTEACMDLVPVPKGERGFLSTGVRVNVRPRPDSDGLYGRLQAINLQTRKTVWVTRERTPLMTGTLETRGGLVFGGSFDREFSAYDDTTGKKLWSTRLSDIPNSNPIAYEVNGTEYIAMVVAGGGLHQNDFDNLYPEVRNPPTRSATLWVFALPAR